MRNNYSEDLNKRIELCKNIIEEGRGLLSLDMIASTVDDCIEQERYFDGYQLLEPLTNLSPNDTDIWLKIGICFSGLMMYNKAISAFNKVLRINRLDIDALLEKIHIYLETGNLTKAKKSLNLAEKIEPDNPQLQALKGDIYFELKSYRQSLAFYLNSIKLDSNIKFVVEKIGACYFNLNDFKKAAEYYELALDEEPDNSILWYYKGLVFVKIRKFEKAVNCFELAIALESRNPAYHTELGLLLENLGRIPQALECFNELVKLGKNKNFAHKKLASLHANMGNFEKAIENLTAITKKEQRDFLYFVDLGSYYLKTDNIDAAGKCLANALNQFKFDFEPPFYVIDEAILNQLSRSESDFLKFEEDILSSGNDDVPALFGLAYLQSFFCRFNKSEKTLYYLLKFPKFRGLAYYELAKLFLIKGKNKKGLLYLKLALKTNSLSITTFFNRRYKGITNSDLFIYFIGKI